MRNFWRYILRFVLIAAIALSTSIACNFSPEPAKPSLVNPSISAIPNNDPSAIEPERIPDAPYLQTPHEIVSKMLTMAKVQPSDLVYDLGSGDGRIPIAAAQKFGAKAIGIEIDPELIRDSNLELNAAIAKTPEIRDRIKFIQQDFFKTDLRDATVVTLYLLPKVNLRVRSEILPKLKAGTRIVSYEYDLGDLPPTQTEKVIEKRQDGDREHTIYLWIL